MKSNWNMIHAGLKLGKSTAAIFSEHWHAQLKALTKGCLRSFLVGSHNLGVQYFTYIYMMA